jgi:hypoxanthine phosphoribosyltransferase
MQTQKATLDNLRAIQSRSTCLKTKKEIDEALDRMAIEITQKLQHDDPVVLTVMTGGLIFSGHLLTRLQFPLETDYVHASRYHDKFSGGAKLKFHAECKTVLKDRSVLLLDDLLDEGITLFQLIAYCKQQGAKAVYTAVLLDKMDVPRGADRGCLDRADFTGMDVENYWLVGFGLDYKNHFRNLDGIYAIADEDKC